jgi:hypothetical protein
MEEMVVVFALFFLLVGMATDGLISSLSQLIAFLVLLLATAIKVRAKKPRSKVS